MTPYQKHRAKWSDCRRCVLCHRRKRVVLGRGTLPARLLLIGEAPGASEDVIGRAFVGPAGKLLNRILRAAIDFDLSVAMTNLVACVPKLPPPTVVNLRREAYDVKIDRSTPWGNPYVIGVDGNRDECVDKFIEYLPEQPKLMRQLRALAGKRLGCHCRPRRCHGDGIVEVFKRVVGTGKVGEPPPEAIKACALRLQELIEICRPEVTVAVGKLAAKHVEFDAEIVHPAAILRMDLSQKWLAEQRAAVVISEAIEGLRR